MTRAGIFDGDLLIVDRGADVKQDQVVIGVVKQEPMVKRLGLCPRHARAKV